MSNQNSGASTMAKGCKPFSINLVTALYHVFIFTSVILLVPASMEGVAKGTSQTRVLAVLVN